jgi:hypothetical protein
MMNALLWIALPLGLGGAACAEAEKKQTVSEDIQKGLDKAGQEVKDETN